jgi:hypothetical protein
MGRIALMLLILVTLLAPLARAEDAPPDPRFGIVEAFVNPEAATEAGAGYTRIILRWDVIQPAGPDDWKPANVPDPAVAAELAAGRQVVAVLIGTRPGPPPRGQAPAPCPTCSTGKIRPAHGPALSRPHRPLDHLEEPDVWDTGHPAAPGPAARKILSPPQDRLSRH